MSWGSLLATKIGGLELMEGFRYTLLTMVVALLLTLGLTPLVRIFATKKGAIDDPTRDDRRVHTTPIPRWGGIAIFGGVLLTLLVMLPVAGWPYSPYIWGMFGLGAVLVVLGALDDVRPLSAKLQALVLLLIGVLVQFPYDQFGRVKIQGMMLPIMSSHAHWVSFGIWGVVLTSLYIFVVTKTMDTIDGIDGLTAGISSIAAGTLSIIATYEGQPRVALLAAAAAGASIGFLRYNYNPARIFMGTGGAQFLGFWLAALSIVGALKTAAALAVFIPILVFGVPLVDAAVVVVRRVASGQPITQADKRHIHHSLLAKGLSQRQAVWVLYLVALALCAALIIGVRMYG
ncbi:MAG: undecaprenyl/decaprenyl-phosphate alpha-N-acetylglucosaminyl 1-phosphate transferase [Armatimonadetes bacterium]|nr:undecaprenyl/decaprenyl-phosphate alpha-N-acetylglucosaminyl 1-phosphate transferase [Armatimonadota bacterium]